MVKEAKVTKEGKVAKVVSTAKMASLRVVSRRGVRDKSMLHSQMLKDRVKTVMPVMRK